MLKFDNISVFYGKKQVLFDISASIERGKFTAIIGRNGSGKSTLLSALTSQTAYSGKILLDGRDISSIDRRERAKMISFLPQNLPVTQFTVGETVAFGREPHISFKLTDADLGIVEKSLEKCGISHLRDKKLTEISGGERQMAYLSMMLAQDADLMLLDEPTTYMDAPNARDFLNILSEERDRGKSVAAVMHDLTTAVKFADNVILIDRGKLIFAGTRDGALSSGIIESTMGVDKYAIEDGTVVFI